MSSTDDLPAALPAMWRALKRGYEAEPLLLSVSFGLTLLAALPDALVALWFKFLANGLSAGRRGLVMASLLGLGASAVASWFLRVVSGRVQRRFRDRLTVALECHVARLQASVSTIEHHERPDYLDRIAVLRNQVFVLDHMYMSIFSTCGWILRLGVTLALLVAIHPALALLAVFALPTVVASTWRPGVERTAEEQGAAAQRLSRHLFDLATTAAPGKEVRVTGIGERLMTQRRDAWAEWYRASAPRRIRSALWLAGGWASSVPHTLRPWHSYRPACTRRPGDVVLVLAAGSRLSAYIGATVGEIGFMRGIWLDGSRRLAWLEDYAASKAQGADAAVPEQLTDGIRFDHVSFAYPGTDRLVLDDVNLLIPPGSVVAIVGENGAGKSTLVKLLSRMYQPTSGRILIDGVALARMPADEWQERLAGAFQDFCQFEFRLQHTVGLGDLSRLTMRGLSGERSNGRVRTTSSSVPAEDSRRSSVRPGRRASISASASGRSWRWRAVSCASNRWCWCWTSPRRHSTPRTSTRSSSGSRQPRGMRGPASPATGASRCSYRTASARCGWLT